MRRFRRFKKALTERTLGGEPGPTSFCFSRFL
jgi:hypothetical protein